jgi:acylphosphatase
VIRRRVVIRGRVQGVYFRDTVRRAAEAAGVAGWVRNNPDGTVEAVLEGAPDAVERVLETCRRGPRGARVEGVEVEPEEPTGASGFRIL